MPIPQTASPGFSIRGIDYGSKTIIHRPICFRKSAAPPSTIVIPSMNSARIAELLGPFLHAPIAAACHSEAAKTGERSAVLSAAQLQDISTYIDILLRWNARINLTAVRDPEAIVTRHFGESLFAARHLFPQSSPVPSVSSVVNDFELFTSNVQITLADVGSGAGFPGLPIKLWAPHLSLTLIESNHKKTAFLREVTRALRLTDVNIQNQRAENLTGHRFDVVTLRAVERFEATLPIAAALVAPAGRLSLLISASQQAQAQAALPQFLWSEPVPLPGSSARILLTGHRHS
jgi:16S rRNA (guanine527-N7)-methyltransferase